MENSELKVYTVIYQLEDTLMVCDAKLPLWRSADGRR